MHHRLTLVLVGLGAAIAGSVATASLTGQLTEFDFIKYWLGIPEPSTQAPLPAVDGESNVSAAPGTEVIEATDSGVDDTDDINAGTQDIACDNDVRAALEQAMGAIENAIDVSCGPAAERPACYSRKSPDCSVPTTGGGCISNLCINAGDLESCKCSDDD